MFARLSWRLGLYWCSLVCVYRQWLVTLMEKWQSLVGTWHPSTVMIPALKILHTPSQQTNPNSGLEMKSKVRRYLRNKQIYCIYVCMVLDGHVFFFSPIYSDITSRLFRDQTILQRIPHRSKECWESQWSSGIISISPSWRISASSLQL